MCRWVYSASYCGRKRPYWNLPIDFEKYVNGNAKKSKKHQQDNATSFGYVVFDFNETAANYFVDMIVKICSEKSCLSVSFLFFQFLRAGTLMTGVFARLRSCDLFERVFLLKRTGKTSNDFEHGTKLDNYSNKLLFYLSGCWHFKGCCGWLYLAQFAVTLRCSFPKHTS